MTAEEPTVEEKLTVEEAFLALESLPPIFPSSLVVKSILDRVEATVWDLPNRRAMCREIDWWRGWLEADTKIKEENELPDIPAIIADATDDLLESVPGFGYWWSGYRTRIWLHPKIVAMREKKVKEHTKHGPH